MGLTKGPIKSVDITATLRCKCAVVGEEVSLRRRASMAGMSMRGPRRRGRGGQELPHLHVHQQW
jgi:hypothetical protein